MRCPCKDEITNVVQSEEEGCEFPSTATIQALLLDGSLTAEEWQLGLAVSRSSTASKSSSATAKASVSGLRLGTFLAGMFAFMPQVILKYTQMVLIFM